MCEVDASKELLRTQKEAKARNRKDQIKSGSLDELYVAHIHPAASGGCGRIFTSICETRCDIKIGAQ